LNGISEADSNNKRHEIGIFKDVNKADTFCILPFGYALYVFPLSQHRLSLALKSRGVKAPVIASYHELLGQ
jgi:hypothetical protein